MPPLTFAAFQSRMKEDRKYYFKPHTLKKLKGKQKSQKKKQRKTLFL